MDVGLDTAGDQVADRAAFGQALAKEVRRDADRRNLDELQFLGVGAEAGEGGPVYFFHTRTVDHHDRGQAGNTGRGSPGGKIHQAISANQEEKLVAWSTAVHGFQRIDTVVRAGSAGFDLGNLEGRIAGRRDPGHLQAMSYRSAVSPLVRRCTCNHKPDAVQPAGLAALLGQDQVAEMNRVERAAEKTQSHDPRISQRILTTGILNQPILTFLWTNVQKSGELAREVVPWDQTALNHCDLTAANLDDRPDPGVLSTMINDDIQREENGSDEVQTTWFGLDGGSAPPSEGVFVGVVLNRPIEQVLTYRAPARVAQSLCPGQRLRVPLGKGNRLTTGYCVSIDSAPPEGLDPRKLKEVVEVLDLVPLIDEKMLELTRWMAEYYICSWGQALDAAVPAGVRNQAGTRIGTFLLVPEEVRQALREQTRKPKLSPKQAAALEVLCRADEPLTIADVCRRAAVPRTGAGPAKTRSGALGAAAARVRA